MSDLLSVVDEVNTPVYIYDLAEIRTNQQRTRAALPRHAYLYYALSTNPHPELLREIRAGGAYAEVCTPGELDIALVAGWPPQQLLYTGRGRRDEDVDWALWLGVREFTVESPAALDQLDRLAGARGVVVDCLLRGGVRWTSPERANVRAIGLRLCPADGLEGLTEETQAVSLRWFDVPLGERLTGLPGRLMVEAGRYLVGSAGTLVTSVLDVREVPGGQIVVLESGANHVGRRALVPRLLSGPAEPDGLLDTTVVGPLEIPVDVWAPSVALPRLRPGDLMMVPDVGADGPTAGLLAFSSAATPAEVVVDPDDPDTTGAHVSRLAVTRYPDGSAP